MLVRRACAALLLLLSPSFITAVQLHHSATSTSTSTATSTSTSTSTSTFPTSGDFDVSSYHSSASIVAQLLSLKSSCSYLHLQYEAREDSLSSQLSVKIDTKSSNNTKHRVLLYFGEHARELISPETSLKLARYLCLTPDTPESVKPAINRVLEYNTIVFYPNINRNMRERSIEQRGLYCSRVNPNGVDLNRNWDDHWSDDYDQPDSNPGGEAFSEEETRILRDAAVVYQPEMFISVHSGTLGMYSPFAYSKDLPPPAVPDAESRPLYTSLLQTHATHSRTHTEIDADIDVEAGEFVHRTQSQLASGNRVASHIKDSSVSSHSISSLMSLTATQPIVAMLEALNPTYCSCSVGAAGATVGYLCPGTSLDWMYDKLDAKFSFAFEIYDGNQGYKTGSLLQTKQQQTSFLETQISRTHVRHHQRHHQRQQRQQHTHTHTHTHGHTHGEDAHSCFFQATPPVRSDDISLIQSSESISRSAAASRLTVKPILSIDDLESRDRPTTSIDLAFPIDSKANRCAHLFNPPTVSLYHSTVDNWSRLMIDLINLVHEYKIALKQKENAS